MIAALTKPGEDKKPTLVIGLTRDDWDRLLTGQCVSERGITDLLNVIIMGAEKEITLVDRLKHLITDDLT
jgi:hypothetical protein